MTTPETDNDPDRVDPAHANGPGGSHEVPTEAGPPGESSMPTESLEAEEPAGTSPLGPQAPTSRPDAVQAFDDSLAGTEHSDNPETDNH